MFPDLTDILIDDLLEFPGPRQAPVGVLHGEDELRPVFLEILTGRLLEHPSRLRPGLEAETREQGLLDAQAEVEVVEVVLRNDDGVRGDGQGHLEGRDLAQPRVPAAEFERRQAAGLDLPGLGGRRLDLHPRSMKPRARLEPGGDGFFQGERPFLGAGRERQDKDDRDGENFPKHDRPPMSVIR